MREKFSEMGQKIRMLGVLKGNSGVLRIWELLS